MQKLKKYLYKSCRIKKKIDIEEGIKKEKERQGSLKKQTKNCVPRRNL
jgi:hypothetical protein